MATPPAGIFAFILIFFLFITFIFDSIWKWPGKMGIGFYYIAGTLFFILVIDYAFYDFEYPKWLVGGLVTGFLFFKLIYDFLNKSENKLLFRLYYLSFVILVFSILTIITLSENKDILDYIMVLKYLLLFVFGYFLFGLLKTSLNSYKTFLLFLLMLFIFLVMNVYFLKGVLIRGSGINPLRLAESFVFIAFLAYVNSENKKLQQLIFMISVFCLALVGSRAALFWFIFVFFVFLFIKYGIIYCLKVSMVYVLVVMGLMAAGVRLFLSNFIHIIDEIMKSKILKLLLIPEKDTSLEMRVELFIKGFERIKPNIIIGDFKGQLDYGDFGFYVHNFFSYWSQFGILVFILFVSLMIMGLVFLFKNYKLVKQNSGYCFIFIYLLYCVLLMLFAKSYVFVNIYIAFGLVLAAKNGENQF